MHNYRVYSISEIKEMITPIAKKYDVEKIYLFGSYARKQANSESDIDLYLEGYVYHKFLNLAHMFEDLENLFSKQIDIITNDDMRLNGETVQNLYNSITNERVLIYER
jgi:hypothetical protein